MKLGLLDSLLNIHFSSLKMNSANIPSIDQLSYTMALKKLCSHFH